jgi:hypothetical protein
MCTRVSAWVAIGTELAGALVALAGVLVEVLDAGGVEVAGAAAPLLMLDAASVVVLVVVAIDGDDVADTAPVAVSVLVALFVVTTVDVATALSVEVAIADATVVIPMAANIITAVIPNRALFSKLCLSSFIFCHSNSLISYLPHCHDVETATDCLADTCASHRADFDWCQELVS